jgi:hypothetical protein
VYSSLSEIVGITEHKDEAVVVFVTEKLVEGQSIKAKRESGQERPVEDLPDLCVRPSPKLSNYYSVGE